MHSKYATVLEKRTQKNDDDDGATPFPRLFRDNLGGRHARPPPSIRDQICLSSGHLRIAVRGRSLAGGDEEAKARACHELPWSRHRLCAQEEYLFFTKILGPILGVSAYWVRSEYQNRGSIHFHGFYWCPETPDLDFVDDILEEASDQMADEPGSREMNEREYSQRLADIANGIFRSNPEALHAAWWYSFLCECIKCVSVRQGSDSSARHRCTFQ